MFDKKNKTEEKAPEQKTEKPKAKAKSKSVEVTVIDPRGYVTKAGPVLVGQSLSMPKDKADVLIRKGVVKLKDSKINKGETK